MPVSDYIFKISTAIYIISLALPFFSNVPLIVLSLGGLGAVFFVQDKKLFSSPVTGFLSLFVLSFLISSVFSRDLEKTLALSPSLLPGLILFFLIVEFYDRQKFYWIFGCFGAASALVSIIALYTAVVSGRPTPSDWVAESGLPYFIVPNDFMLLAVFIPFFMFIVLRQKQFTFRAAAMIIIALDLSVFTVFRSRGAILLSLAAVGLPWVLLTRSYKKIVLTLLTGIAVVVMIDFFTGFQLAHKLAAGSGSWLTRLAPWSAAWEIFKSSPLIGTGPRTFGRFYPQMPWTHSLYLETLAEQGLLGITALAGLIISMGQALRKPMAEDDIAVVLFVSGLILFLGGIIEFSFVRHLFVIVFFVIVSLTIGVSLPPSGASRMDSYSS